MQEEENVPQGDLRREVSLFGAFSIGYADVGADIYITLGLVALYAGGATPLALIIAGIVYVLVGSVYAKLSGRYPYAGGAQFYAQRALGPMHGFIAGWGLMLDYTIDIALFVLASVGYLGYLLKATLGFGLLLVNPYYAFVSAFLVGFLGFLNILGIRESVRLNKLFVALDLATLFLVLGVGGSIYFFFNGFSWKPPSIGQDVPVGNFLYAVTIAMASYVGVEAISQAAEETSNASKNVPKATYLTVSLTLLVALAGAFFIASSPVNNEEALHPFAGLALKVPIIGTWLALWVGLMGFLINLASANSGVIGVSRVAYSMARTGLLPEGFRRISRRGVPHISIAVFTVIAMGLIIVNGFTTSLHLLELVASLYNFGAIVAYIYASISLVKLSANRHEKLLGILATVACIFMLTLLVLLHPEGRILALLWFLVGLTLYFLKHRPVHK
jgi:APA family basic amino acid/polyamine antiporter